MTNPIVHTAQHLSLRNVLLCLTLPHIKFSDRARFTRTKEKTPVLWEEREGKTHGSHVMWSARPNSLPRLKPHGHRRTGPPGSYSARHIHSLMGGRQLVTCGARSAMWSRRPRHARGNRYRPPPSPNHHQIKSKSRVRHGNPSSLRSMRTHPVFPGDRPWVGLLVPSLTDRLLPRIFKEGFSGSLFSSST